MKTNFVPLLLLFIVGVQSSELFGQMSVSVETDITPCAAVCNASATVEVMNGVGPFEYSWSNGGIGQVQSGWCTGLYSVTVIDLGTNEIITEHFIVFTQSQPFIALSLIATTASSTAQSCDGTATVEFPNAVPPIQIVSTSGSVNMYSPNGAVISGLCAGSLDVGVIDEIGCTSYSPINIPLGTDIPTIGQWGSVSLCLLSLILGCIALSPNRTSSNMYSRKRICL